VIVTISLDDLQGRLAQVGAGTLDTGIPISADETQPDGPKIAEESNDIAPAPAVLAKAVRSPMFQVQSYSRNIRTSICL
jgi:hypothetical protein